ncbi:MAG: CoA-binding protein [Chloroflexi bacterium]|nr:CoA-binding protein [Chloroflexota bacterium]
MKNDVINNLFNPASIALVGVSSDITKPSAAQWFLKSLINFGYKGSVYGVHPSGGEIYGIKIYTNVNEIPGPLDYVVSAIPARFTPGLLKDCAAKGVKVVHLFTSGYSEIEDAAGKNLEAEVLNIARQSGIRIIGPNCMGFYCPSAGVTFAGEFPEQPGFPKKAGSLGLISQSGGNCIFCIRDATSRGVFFSKAISFGNAADINESDLLEYMTDDPETKIIGMYLEGVADGPRFKKVLKEAVIRKPVIVNKAGNSETGARMCSSHTGAIAGSAGTWRSFLRQAGAIQVENMSEIVDISAVFTYLPRPAGRNVAVIGTGGGVGVQAADDVIKAGLRLPMLQEDVRRKLHEIYGSEAGSIFRNPVDVPPFASPEQYVTAVKAVADSDNIDIVLIHFPFDIWALANKALVILPFSEMVAEVVSSIKKPLAVVLHYCVSAQAQKLAGETQEKFVKLGLPVFPSISRAASAVNKYIAYSEFKVAHVR